MKETPVEWPIPDMRDVLLARQRIAPFLQPTPLFTHPALSELVGTEVWVKHENHQPVGAFKVRGGINLLSTLSDEERGRGVAAASTGNHGQSVAYAARLFGVHAVVIVPVGANPVKVAAMRGLGSEVIEHGRDFDEAREYCAALAAERGYRYIHSGNEPLLIAGVATLTLEILERQPEIDVLIGPVGGGSGMAGACIVRWALRPGLELIAVQSGRGSRGVSLLEGAVPA
jgi:threonine dehydratase